MGLHSQHTFRWNTYNQLFSVPTSRLNYLSSSEISVGDLDLVRAFTPQVKSFQLFRDSWSKSGLYTWPSIVWFAYSLSRIRLRDTSESKISVKGDLDLPGSNQNWGANISSFLGSRYGPTIDNDFQCTENTNSFLHVKCLRYATL